MLDRDQVREFFETGFLVLPDQFGEAELERIRRAFERLLAAASTLSETTMLRGSQFVVDRPAAGGALRIHRVVWCGAAEPELLELGRDRRLLLPVGQLLGTDRVQQLINQAHFKLPGDGVEFPWHQDSTHRRYGRGEWTDVNGRGSYVQTVIAVDDSTEENGPLQFVRGSAGLGHLELAEGGLAELAQRSPESIVSAVARAGSLILFGPYTIHRSLPNTSGRPRRAFINGYASPGANTRVYPGEGSGRLLDVA